MHSSPVGMVAGYHRTPMVTRRFLGSGTHLLPMLAGELVASSGGDVDLQRHIVVLPTGRARRQLERLLLQQVQSPRVLTPPEMLTPARLLDRLIAPARTLASAMAMAAAWTRAVELLELDHRAALVGHEEALSPAEADALATRLARLTRELASHDLEPADVPGRCEALSLPVDGAVWDAIETARNTMLAWIQERGLADRDASQGEALANGVLHTAGITAVTVVGADLQGRAARCLEVLSSSGIEVTTVVHDTGDDRDAAWTPLGVVDPTVWMSRPIAIPDSSMTACPSLDDQSAAALDALASLGEAEAASVRVVAPDEYLRKSFLAAARSEGVAVDCWEGDPSSASRLGHLIQLLIPLAETASATATGDLLRHPDIEAWLVRSGMFQPLSLWDDMWSRHAPHDLACFAQVVVKEHHKTLLTHLRAIVSRLEGDRTLSAWADVVMALLLDVLDGADLDDVTETVLEQIHALLTDLHELPPGGDDWTAASVLRLLMSGLAAHTIAANEASGGVEVIGWLDAHLDDAPNLVIMGMNEGIVPSSPGVDPWLPEAHRAAIGLDCRARRVARDAYLLAATIESGRDVRLITSRATNGGEPLAPSGLLLRDEGEPLARRVLRFVGEDDASSPRMFRRRAAAGESSAFDAAALPEGDPIIASMSVTAFRGFIRDPYEFLLRRDLRIRAKDLQTHYELDAMQFGTLVHDVLEHWGRGEMGQDGPTIEASHIERDLHDALDQFVRQRFGSNPLPMVRLQAEMVRSRLSVFATRQAERAAQGWKVHAVELSFGDSAHDDYPSVPFPSIDGLPLRGKIDRIDLHEELGFQALDYKTGKSATGAKKSHWTSRSGWIDLQLPLYRALLRSIGTEVPASGLGYVLIPAIGEDCGFDLAGWTDAELEEAEAEAAEIVRIITSGELMAYIEESLA